MMMVAMTIKTIYLFCGNKIEYNNPIISEVFKIETFKTELNTTTSLLP